MPSLPDAAWASQPDASRVPHCGAPTVILHRIYYAFPAGEGIRSLITVRRPVPDRGMRAAVKLLLHRC